MFWVLYFLLATHPPLSRARVPHHQGHLPEDHWRGLRGRPPEGEAEGAEIPDQEDQILDWVQQGEEEQGIHHQVQLAEQGILDIPKEIYMLFINEFNLKSILYVHLCHFYLLFTLWIWMKWNITNITSHTLSLQLIYF